MRMHTRNNRNYTRNHKAATDLRQVSLHDGATQLLLAQVQQREPT
eukprot:NODE_10589_length_237_cov_14.627660_g9848_i0.p1 GENE.NODE_10589_length_237_cov_14.627660_g9848_i0~~NODE_10589_length_237_cov_14.627660_g9848_i0.p1  ORF type:complete len:52 (-),score=6.97 NODE_10589_length_237_cov_14.627660_g9848_i0:80-214(-)